MSGHKNNDMTMPPLPKPDLEDHEHEAWGQNVIADFVTVEKMRKYGDDRAAAALAACIAICADYADACSTVGDGRGADAADWCANAMRGTT